MTEICRVCGEPARYEFKPGEWLCAVHYYAYRQGYFEAMKQVRDFTQGMGDEE